ncbi:HPP family protein [Patescibacteria group bacterium]
MSLKKFIKKERKLWHQHFIPSLIAGVGMALITFVFEFTTSGIVIFASVGASAIILANNKSHHLTKLRTSIFAYIIAVTVSTILFYLNQFFQFHLSVSLFLAVFSVSIAMYLLNVFHPPAISATVAFLLFERGVVDLIFLLLSVIMMLIVIRILSYIFSQHLSLREFYKEFRKEF